MWKLFGEANVLASEYPEVKNGILKCKLNYLCILKQNFMAAVEPKYSYYPKLDTREESRRFLKLTRIQEYQGG